MKMRPYVTFFFFLGVARREEGGEGRGKGGEGEGRRGGGLSMRDIGKGNQMTVLRFQTRGRHQPLWPPFGGPVLTFMETNSVQTTAEILSQKYFSLVPNKDIACRLLTLCLLWSLVLLVLVLVLLRMGSKSLSKTRNANFETICCTGGCTKYRSK